MATLLTYRSYASSKYEFLNKDMLSDTLSDTLLDAP